MVEEEDNVRNMSQISKKHAFVLEHPDGILKDLGGDTQCFQKIHVEHEFSCFLLQSEANFRRRISMQSRPKTQNKVRSNIKEQ